MKQSEQASLQSLQSLEQSPSPQVWEKICEEWERGSLEQSLNGLSEQPNPSHWNRVATKLSKRSSRLTYSISILFIAGISLAVMYYYAIPNTDQIKSVQFVSVTQEKIQSPSIPPLPTPPTQIDITPPRPDQQLKKSNRQSPENYLWLASRSGEPIRIHARWQELSCCVSGETQGAECYEQKQQWHREIEASNLGFQADPLLGLIELLEPEPNPSTFSPILCP